MLRDSLARALVSTLARPLRTPPSASFHNSTCRRAAPTPAMSDDTSNSIPYTVPIPGGIPDTHRPHTERTTTILVPKNNTTFLNPVQEYNRDLSVSVIRAWNELHQEELEARWRKALAKKGGKRGKGGAAPASEAPLAAPPATGTAEEEALNAAGPSAPAAAANQVGVARSSRTNAQPVFKPAKITILEALSATGLRSIRYAKEIPNVKVVLANDLSPSACDSMRRNVALNGVGEPAKKGAAAAAPEADVGTGVDAGAGAAASEGEGAEGAVASDPEAADLGRRDGCDGYVRVNEGDALDLMYAHRQPKNRVQVVDLDPYGTAAPFIDSAIQSIADGGLLCVTCTDLAVLAGSSYPEKCFSNYGGVCVDAEYSHEVALRLVLNSIAQTAARYQRFITPLISFSIDFYVRLFIRVDSKPIEVKRLQSQTGVVYVCSHCESPVVQPFGKIIEREGKEGKPYSVYKASTGPAGPEKCAECGSAQHLGGPMWLGPIHDKEFVARVLRSIEGDRERYGTWPRMHGMLTMAHEELPDPFYFTSNKVFGYGRSTPAPTKEVVSALVNAGYKVSRSHASSGSIKTDAPRSFVYDIVRERIKTKPVRLDKIPEGSPTRALIAKPMTHAVDFTPNPEAKRFDKSSILLYQANPQPNWGPGARARSVRVEPVADTAGVAVPAAKRKSEDAPGGGVGAEASVGKKPKVDVDEGDAEVDEDDEEAAMNA